MTASKKHGIIKYNEKQIKLESEDVIMERRDVKEMAVARETLYGEIARGLDLDAAGYVVVGMGKEGFIVQDTATGLYAQIKVVAKGLDFDASDALQEYEDARVKAIEKKAKHDEKVAKELAKKAKAKAEKEAAEVEAEVKN